MKKQFILLAILVAIVAIMILVVLNSNVLGSRLGASTALISGTNTTSQLIDGTPPQISITSPVNGSVVSGTITVAAKATDNVGIAKVEFFYNWFNQPIGTDTTAPYSVEWNTTNIPCGTYKLYARATDTSGNTNIDLIQPSITILCKITSNPILLSASQIPTTSGCALGMQMQSTPSAQLVSAGTNNFVFSRVKLSAPSVCSIRVTNIPVQVGRYLNLEDLSNISLYTSPMIQKIGSKPGQVSSFWHDIPVNLTIPAGTSQIIDLVADISPATPSGSTLQLSAYNDQNFTIGRGYKAVNASTNWIITAFNFLAPLYGADMTVR